MNGHGGLSGWRWLFIFDGIITFPMAIWGMQSETLKTFLYTIIATDYFQGILRCLISLPIHVLSG